MVNRADFLDALRAELPAAVHLLQAESILPVDLAQSAIGPGMAVFSRYSKVIEADGSAMTVRHALARINEVLQEVLSKEETEFDGDTRWALTWYEENGFAAGDFGRAETLSKAKDTSITGVVNAGIAINPKGKVQLVAVDALSNDWDPTYDDRPTVWELTHHLIQRLDSSETEAARLLQRVGAGYGDRARQLAYLLFDIAERKGRAKDAVAYNSLIQAWPELTGLASAPTQTTLAT
jgi:putative DNA methylase